MSIYNSSSQPSRNDLYETPPATLDMILRYLDPTKHLIWEPFKGSGHSTRHMRSRNFTVSNGDDPDFFKQNIPRIEGLLTNGANNECTLLYQTRDPGTSQEDRDEANRSLITSPCAVHQVLS